MDYKKITTCDEAKAYFETLWRPMSSACILNNLQKILNFLQSPAEEVCFINMQEQYLPFYYMIVLDPEFLQTTFLTDECKVVASEILRILDANKNLFTWEVSFSRQIAGIPVVFRKVYTQLTHLYPRERFEKPIRTEFKETWIGTTLKFIKSSRLILKYPEMPRNEAVYLYKGILKQNDDELGSDSLWAPVWEALSIFKLRYQYIVSLHPTAFEYLKFVHFEKVILCRNNAAIKNKSPVGLLNDEPKFIKDTNISGDNTKSSHNESVNNVVLPVFNHNELVKTLLEMKFTKSGKLVYTLKIDECNMLPGPLNEPLLEVTELSDFENELKESEIITPYKNSESTNDQVESNLTIAVKDVVDDENEKNIDLNVKSSQENAMRLEETTMLNNNTTRYQNEAAYNENKWFAIEYHENKIANVNANENCEKFKAIALSNIKNKIALEDLTLANVTSAVENEEHCDNERFEIFKSANVIDLALYRNTDSDVPDESIELTKPNETDSINENLLFQQIVKMQNQNRPLFLKEEDFMVIDNTSKFTQIQINEPICANVNEPNQIHIDNPKQVQLTEPNENKHAEINEPKQVEANEPEQVEANEPKQIKANEPTQIQIKEPKHDQLNESEHAKVNKFKWNKINRSNNKKNIECNQNKPLTKAQRRQGTKIRQKRRLVESVSTKFIITSFQAILDFIDDDLRASMEMVSLTIQEFNILRKFHGFSPKLVPTEKVFDKTCAGLVKELFDSLEEKDDYCLDITWFRPCEVKSHKSSGGEIRQRSLLFTKRPFKKSRNKIVPELSTQDIGEEEDTDFEDFRKPKSILEKMRLISPVKTGTPSGSSRESLIRCTPSRSPSVSPSRPAKSKMAVGRKLTQQKARLLKLDNKISDKTLRTPAQESNPTLAMKTKLLEGLAIPLESDKAMRMMKLMGWKGGALGVRGHGLIEPIQPALDVPRGVGLGHKKYELIKKNIKNIQRKVLQQKMMSVETSNTVKMNKLNSKTLNNNAFNVNENVSLNEVSSNVTNDPNASMKSKSEADFKEKIEDSDMITNEITSEKILDRHFASDEKAVKSNLDTDSNEKIENQSCLTNDCLLQKVNDIYIASDNEEVKSNIETDSDEKIESSGWQTNKDLLQTAKDRYVTKDEEAVTSYIEIDSEEEMENSGWLTNESLLRKIKDRTTHVYDNNDQSKFKEEFNLYTCKKKAKCLSDRTQFLVHLLDLLQSYDKNFTVVSYTQKPSMGCIEFIESIISCLNQGQNTEPELLREVRIMKVCTWEMAAHSHMVLSYQFNKKSLTLVKTDRLVNIHAWPGVRSAEDFDMKTAVSIDDFNLRRQIPWGTKTANRTKVLTNRAILEFVKSGDEEIVYNYGKTPVLIRLYIASLISLLNRQMAEYQLGLGKSEQKVFREILDRMEDFCLIFRFNTQKSYFNKLQLVKVNLAKRCRVCEIANQPDNSLDKVDQPIEISDDEAEAVNDIDDIDIYPNRFKDDDDIYESDNNIRCEIIHNSEELNNEEVIDVNTSGDHIDEVKGNEEYLIGEDWLDSYVIDEASTKDDSVKQIDLYENENNKTVVENISQNIFFNTEEASVQDAKAPGIDAVKNNATENVYGEEMSLDFHNWPKRIRKNEMNNNLTNDSIEWNSAEIYDESNQDLKRKIVNIGLKAINEDVVKEDELDDVLNIELNNSRKKLKALTKIAQLNTEEIHEGIIETIADRVAAIETLDNKEETCENAIETSDNLIEDTCESTTEDKAKDVIDGEAAEITNKDVESFTPYVKPRMDGFDEPQSLLIVHYEFPKYNFDANAGMLLQTTIYEAIHKQRFLPRIKCGGLKNGGVLYTCYDRDSYIWLYDQLQWYYMVLDYEQVLNTTHIIDLKINSFVKVDIDGVFSNIELFYENIKTASWKVIQTKEFADYCVITIEIDDWSLMCIKKEDYSLFVGIDRADVSLIYD